MLVRSFHFKLLIFHSTPHLLYFLAFNAQGIFQFGVAQSVAHKYFSCLKPGSKSGQKEIPKTCNMINFCARYSLGKQENPEREFPSRFWLVFLFRSVLAGMVVLSIMCNEDENVHFSLKYPLCFKVLDFCMC